MPSVPRHTASTALAAALVLLWSWPARAETVFEDFPLAVWAGLEPGERPGEDAAKTLPDLPFEAGRGYGHVGGRAGRLHPGAAFLGNPNWPLVWREGVEKYVFRVPRGEYIVELLLLETDVAWSGLRVFDVLVEDREVFPRVDIAHEAGDFTWLTLRAAAAVYDGWLDLRFVAVTGDRSPRVSRLRILRGDGSGAPDGIRSGIEAPALNAFPGPARVVLRWEAGSFPGVCGYGVFRADAPRGPFEPLTPEPLRVPYFADGTAEPGKERFYKVRAYGTDGAQGSFSDVRAAAAREGRFEGLQTFELSLQPDDLRRLSIRRDPGEEVPAELRWNGALYSVLVRYDTRPGRWQKKKSLWITPEEERNRSIQRRKSIYLSAEPGDPTLLREKVASEAAAAVGLASPLVEPVALFLNGAYLGLYHDIEPLDRRFRRRARLDRAGLLAVETRGDILRDDWVPPGEQRGEEGNIMALTELVHELNRLGEGEMRSFFSERFYLDRHIDRLAFQAIRGGVGKYPGGRYLLRDSRNGKWETFEERHPDGSFGVEDFGASRGAVSEPEARQAILGASRDAAAAPGRELSVLDTRFFGQIELRARLFDRIEALLGAELSAEKLEAIVDHAFARIRHAALADSGRWPDEPDAAAFLGGPARIKTQYRARSEALRRALATERARRPDPLVLNEILAVPAEGHPWIEVRNASAEPVKLDGTFLEARLIPGGPSQALPEGKTLGPGEILLLTFADSDALSPRASGGYLALSRRLAPGRTETCDALFYGRQTRGISYGRLAGGQWAHLAKPTGGVANDPEALAPPAYEFRQGIVAKKGPPTPESPLGTQGDVTIWLKTRSLDPDPAKKAQRVTLHYHEEGADPFETVDLGWSAESFQHAINLTANPKRKRTAYYFTLIGPSGLERAYPLPAPDLKFFLPVSPVVKLNEVLPRPRRGPGSPGEFIEIYNPGDQPVSLEGYFLTDSSRNPTRWRIPGGNPIGPKGFAVFYADGANRGNHAGFKLSNSGEFLGLFGRMEEGNLLIDSTAFRGVRTGESWGASPDGSKSFRSWKDPTPGARNVPKIPEEYLKKRREAAADPVPPQPPVEGGERPEPEGADPDE